MIELSPLTRRHVLALFQTAEIEDAERLLAQECGDNLPLVGKTASPASLERVRFAALRVSGGKIDRLREAIRLAQNDWRDLLVAAGFAEDLRAHERWCPQRCDTELVDRWMAGELLSGVRFRFHHPVNIVAGPRRGQSGTVIGLMDVEPEPRYRVELALGEDVEEYQRTLGNSG